MTATFSREGIYKKHFLDLGILHEIRPENKKALQAIKAVKAVSSEFRVAAKRFSDGRAESDWHTPTCVKQTKRMCRIYDPEFKTNKGWKTLRSFEFGASMAPPRRRHVRPGVPPLWHVEQGLPCQLVATTSHPAAQRRTGSDLLGN